VLTPEPFRPRLGYKSRRGCRPCDPEPTRHGRHLSALGFGSDPDRNRQTTSLPSPRRSPRRGFYFPSWEAGRLFAMSPPCSKQRLTESKPPSIPAISARHRGSTEEWK